MSAQGSIRFYMDFASPYAYFASGEIERIGAEFGRAVEWRPILMWAVLKAHEIAPPMELPVKRAYFIHDMARSAAFYGLPYIHPAKLPFSSHLAARLHHAIAASEPEKAQALAHRIYAGVFQRQENVADEATLTALAASVGISSDTVAEAIRGPQGRALLEAAVNEAITAGVVGSPYFVVDGEGFFGADRLPQLRWFLSGGRA